MVPVLFIVTEDPRTSPRPAEALRIATGVGSWGTVSVTIYLRGKAILTLGDEADELMDGADLARYWPVVAGWNQPVRVQAGAMSTAEFIVPAVSTQEITDEELACLAAEQQYVLRF